MQHQGSQAWDSPLSQPLSKLEVSISCKDLKNMDFFSKSDPMVVVYQKHSLTGRWNEIGRTETIDDNLNPEFVKKFIVDYFFEEVQHMKFEVYDIDYDTRNLEDQDFIGCVELNLAEIAQGSVTRELYDPKNGTGRSHGQITIAAEELNSADNEKVFTIQATASHVQKIKGFLFSSTPNVFLQISKSYEGRKDTAVYRTLPLHTTHPIYTSFDLSARDLCNGDLHRKLSFSLINQASNGDLKVLHTFNTTPFEMENHPRLDLNESSQSGKCSLTLQTRTITKPSFLHYMNSGLELNFHVAIDFTASNGDPVTPTSLHYISEHRMNSYEFAINCIGEVLQQYDTDKMFPAYGFGARLPPQGVVSHDFALSFNPQQPEVYGVEGIIEAYKRSLASVRLYGPTNFSPIIRKVTNHVREMEMETSKLYSVLMILTDGIITDMDQTIEAIVEAADHAMSIVIIGVGEANFDNMEILDGDDVRLKSKRTGQLASRDIVQFVPLNAYFSTYTNSSKGLTRNESTYHSNSHSKQKFSQEVLHEIPQQVVDYFASTGKFPLSQSGRGDMMG